MTSLALGLALLGTSGCQGDPVPADPEDTDSTGPSDSDPGEESTSGGADETGTETGTETGEPEPESAVPPPGGLRRMLGHQYVASIDYLLGPQAAAVADPPPDPSIGTFDAMATLVSTPSVTDVEAYEDSAAAAAAYGAAEPERLAFFAPCVNIAPYPSCYETVARDFGRVAWRRPLTDEQIERLVAVGQAAYEWDENNFTTGLRYLLTSILQSPYFLYMVELGEGDGDEGFRELDGYELATRMSFFLMGRTPTIQVLDRAEAGDFDTDEGVRALAWDMLDTPQARVTVGRFYDELLTVRDLESKGKDPVLFPEFGILLASSMHEETLRLVDDVIFEEDSSVLRLFDARYTFVDTRLAMLYGVTPPASGIWQRIDLPESRAGVLSLSGWLTMASHNTVNSPTRRGLFVMEQLLCAEVPLPPPRVNPEPIEPSEGQTLRESLEQHMTDEACSGCHILMDPIGFGFEHFNPVGGYQLLDNGKPIDATGTLPAGDDFDGAAELADLLVEDPRLGRCLVDKAYTGGLGFVPEMEEPALDQVGSAFATNDHNMKQLLVELTASPVFRLVDEPK